MTPHTPGPWAVQTDHFNSGKPASEGLRFNIYSTAADVNIAEVWDDFEQEPGEPQSEGLAPTGTAEANARLIAAAPAMLIALRAIRDSCPTDNDVTREFNAAWVLLEAAIEKAEGR